MRATSQLVSYPGHLLTLFMSTNQPTAGPGPAAGGVPGSRPGCSALSLGCIHTQGVVPVGSRQPPGAPVHPSHPSIPGQGSLVSVAACFDIARLEWTGAIRPRVGPWILPSLTRSTPARGWNSFPQGFQCFMVVGAISRVAASAFPLSIYCYVAGFKAAPSVRTTIDGWHPKTKGLGAAGSLIIPHSHHPRVGDAGRSSRNGQIASQ